MPNKLRILTDALRRLKSLKATRVVVVCKFFVCCFWLSPRFTLGFYFAYLYMLISHVRKELSHSDWLVVCKLKTNSNFCKAGLRRKLDTTAT